MFSRRSLLTGSLALVFTPATAVLARRQRWAEAEWQQNYEAVARTRVQRTTTPILSPADARRDRADDRAISGHRRPGRLAAAPHQRPAAGRREERGRARVAPAPDRRPGDLDSSAGEFGVYNSYVEAGVHRFQARHGLNATGAMSSADPGGHEHSADMRLRQLETNLVRLRTYSGNLGERYVIVNIPAALVETVEGGGRADPPRRRRRQDRPPVADHERQDQRDQLQPVLERAGLDHPQGSDPEDAEGAELPHGQQDPHLRRDGKEIDPPQVNWYTEDATNYRFRQDPGGDVNSMGSVHINIPNPHGVYMHDTPSKGMFGDDLRFVRRAACACRTCATTSTGCSRTRPAGVAQHIDATIRAGARTDARSTQPVPVYCTYITAWATPDGVVQFRDDIYNRDGLGSAVPVASRVPTEPDEEMFLQN